MKKAIVLVSIVIIYALVFIIDARAYSYIGGKWTEPITYDGDPLIGRALEEWGKYANLPPVSIDKEHPAIRLIHQDPWTMDPHILGVAWMGGDGVGRIYVCEITVPRETFYGVVLHEVGHCLGLGHSEDKNSDMYPACCNPINRDDIAGIQGLYGPPPSQPKPQHPHVMRYQLIGVSRD